MLRFLTVMLALALLGSVSLAADPAKPKRSAEDRFARADKNGDKKLSLEEFLGKRSGDKKEKATKRFGKIDKNADGSLSLEEFTAAQKTSD